MPKVSVNIPCFNSEKYIAETLQSVLNQTFEDFEIIVVNDGSTDRTEEIIKTFSDSRVKYYYQKNMGLSNTRNRQLALSSGEFIAFLDSDDIWMPEKLELQIRALATENANFCYTKIRRVTYSKEGEEISSKVIGKKIPYSGHKLIIKLCEGNPITVSSVMIESKLCKKIGFNPRLKRLNDYDHILRASPNIYSSYVDKELVIYRMHPTNITSLLHDIASEELKIINESFVELNFNKYEKMKFHNNIIVTQAYEKAGASFYKFVKHILQVLISDPFFTLRIILRWLKENK